MNQRDLLALKRQNFADYFDLITDLFIDSDCSKSIARSSMSNFADNLNAYVHLFILEHCPIVSFNIKKTVINVSTYRDRFKYKRIKLL